MIEWYCEAAREDADPQRYDARVGHLFLRVVEADHDDPYGACWGVSLQGHPPFEDELDELSIACGESRSIAAAKDACRTAVKRIVATVERRL